MKIAHRYEVARSVVDASSSTRHRVTNSVAEDNAASSPDMSQLESRVVTLERQLQAQLPSTDSATSRRDRDVKKEMPEQSWTKHSKRDKSRSDRAVNSQEPDVKDELLRRIAELETARAVGQQQVAKLTAENVSLNKEVGRLKHVTELRSSSMVASSQPVNSQSEQKPSVSWSNSQRPARVCWSCGEPGHFANKCGRRSSGVTQDERKNQSSYQFKMIYCGEQSPRPSQTGEWTFSTFIPLSKKSDLKQ